MAAPYNQMNYIPQRSPFDQLNRQTGHQIYREENPQQKYQIHNNYIEDEYQYQNEQNYFHNNPPHDEQQDQIDFIQRQQIQDQTLQNQLEFGNQGISFQEQANTVQYFNKYTPDINRSINLNYACENDQIQNQKFGHQQINYNQNWPIQGTNRDIYNQDQQYQQVRSGSDRSKSMNHHIALKHNLKQDLQDSQYLNENQRISNISQIQNQDILQEYNQIEGKIQQKQFNNEEDRIKQQRNSQNDLKKQKKTRSSSLRRNDKLVTAQSKNNNQNSLETNLKTKSSQFYCPVSYNEVYVWGANRNGQLGLGQIDSDNDNSDEDMEQKERKNISYKPKICCFNTVIKKVSCGMSHTIMLSLTGHVYSMGSNQHGQLGLNAPQCEIQSDGKEIILNKQVPCLIESLSNQSIIDIASGNDHCLALSQDGDKIFSWGQGKFGALGTSKSQNLKAPSQLILKKGQQVFQIAAGSRHSAFILKQTFELYTFGLALHGQLGLGEECTDRAFIPEKVELSGIKVKQVALGDTHSLIITQDGYLMSTGANDKYQLGMDPEKRSLKLFTFNQLTKFRSGEKVDKNVSFQDVIFKNIQCWNLNAAIDQQDRVYLWGILHDKQVKQSLCIKVPERVNSFKVQDVSIGPTMAFIVEKETSQSCVIGVNAKGELGLGDKEQRKTFCILPDLKDKKIKQVGIGKSGFVIAISEQINEPNEQLIEDLTPSREQRNSNKKSERPNKQEQNNQKTEFQNLQTDENDQTVLIEQTEPSTKQQIVEIQKQVNDLQNLTNMNIKIQQLENNLQKKQQIIVESAHQHSSLLEKINQLEKRLEEIDKKQKIDQITQDIQLPQQQLEVQVEYQEQIRLAQPLQKLGFQSKQNNYQLSESTVEKRRQPLSPQILNDQMSKVNSNSVVGYSHSNQQVTKRQNLPNSKNKNDNNLSDLSYQQDNISKAETGSAAFDGQSNNENDNNNYQQKSRRFSQKKTIPSGCQIKMRDDQTNYDDIKSQNENQRNRIASYRAESPLTSYNDSKQYKFQNDLKYQKDLSHHQKSEYKFNQNKNGQINNQQIKNSQENDKYQKTSEQTATTQKNLEPVYKNDMNELENNNLKGQGVSGFHEHFQNNINMLEINQDLIKVHPSYNVRTSLTADLDEQRNIQSSPYQGGHSQILHNNRNEYLQSQVSRPRDNLNFQNQQNEFIQNQEQQQQYFIYQQQINDMSSQLQQKELDQAHLKQQLILLDGENKNIKMNFINKEAEADSLKQQCEILEQENYQQKMDLLKKEKDQKDYEGRIESLTQKLDSLVRFLEEERTLRKQAESQINQKESQVQEQNGVINKFVEEMNRKAEEINNLQIEINEQKETLEEQRRQRQIILEDKQEMQHKAIDLESRLRTLQKQYEQKQQEFERNLQEKYDAQTKQFLLQQEMNQNNNQQIHILAKQNKDGIEVQKKMLEVTHNLNNLKQFQQASSPQNQGFFESNLIRTKQNINPNALPFQPFNNLSTIDSQIRQKNISPKIQRDQLKIMPVDKEAIQSEDKKLLNRDYKALTQDIDSVGAQYKQFQSYQETNQQSAKIINANKSSEIDKKQFVLNSPTLNLNRKNQNSLQLSNQNDQQIQKESAEFPFRNYKEYIYDWMKKKVGQDDEQDYQKPIQQKIQEIQQKNEPRSLSQNEIYQNSSILQAPKINTKIQDKNLSLYAITSSGLLSRQFDSKDGKEIYTNSYDTQKNKFNDLNNSYYNKIKSKFGQDKFLQKDKSEELKKTEWLKDYNNNKEFNTLNQNNEKVKSLERIQDGPQQQINKSVHVQNYQSKLSKQSEEGNFLNPKYFQQNLCLSESQNSKQMRLSIKNGMMKTYDIPKQSLTTHDNLEAHTLSSNTQQSPYQKTTSPMRKDFQSVNSSPQRLNMPTNALIDQRINNYDPKNQGSNNTTFRTRIENLLPDRLKTQYENQQKTWTQQNQF